MLAKVPNARVGSGSGSDPEPNRCNGSYHTKTRTVAIGPVLPPKTRHFNITTLAPIKYLSWDRIMTWWVRRLFSSCRSFTSWVQICDPTNIRWVAIENPLISVKICPYFIATQRISVGSQIWKREAKEQLELYNLCTDHVMIRSELKYLIGAKVAGTVKWNRGPVRVTTPPRQSWSGSLAVPNPDRGLGSSSNPDRSRVTRNRC